MNESAVIILPIPNKVLSPNFNITSMRGRFMIAAAAKKAKKVSCEAAESLMLHTTPWQQVSVQYRFYYATNRNRDIQNCEGSMKAYLDGIVQAGIMPDDSYQYCQHKQSIIDIDKDHPRVEVEIERIK